MYNTYQVMIETGIHNTGNAMQALQGRSLEGILSELGCNHSFGVENMTGHVNQAHADMKAACDEFDAEMMEFERRMQERRAYHNQRITEALFQLIRLRKARQHLYNKINGPDKLPPPLPRNLQPSR